MLKCTKQNAKFGRRYMFSFLVIKYLFCMKENFDHTVYLWLYGFLNKGHNFFAQHQLIGLCKPDVVYLV